jgi:hypothetical protein
VTSSGSREQGRNVWPLHESIARRRAPEIGGHLKRRQALGLLDARDGFRHDPEKIIRVQAADAEQAKAIGRATLQSWYNVYWLKERPIVIREVVPYATDILLSVDQFA